MNKIPFLTNAFGKICTKVSWCCIDQQPLRNLLIKHFEIFSVMYTGKCVCILIFKYLDYIVVISPIKIQTSFLLADLAILVMSEKYSFALCFMTIINQKQRHKGQQFLRRSVFNCTLKESNYSPWQRLSWPPPFIQQVFLGDPLCKLTLL